MYTTDCLKEISQTGRFCRLKSSYTVFVILQPRMPKYHGDAHIWGVTTGYFRSNMERHWKHAGIQIVKTDGAHYLPLAEIVRSVIPDCGLIAKKFSKASDTYDSNATAQREIAGRLAAMLDSLPIPPRPKILEIGYGNGTLHPCICRQTKTGNDRFCRYRTCSANASH